jgi:hypothetical protein
LPFDCLESRVLVIQFSSTQPSIKQLTCQLPRALCTDLSINRSIRESPRILCLFFIDCYELCAVKCLDPLFPCGFCVPRCRLGTTYRFLRLLGFQGRLYINLPPFPLSLHLSLFILFLSSFLDLPVFLISGNLSPL